MVNFNLLTVMDFPLLLPLVTHSVSVLIVLGAGVMGLSILKTRRIRSLLKNQPGQQGWEILLYLMTFFLLGYSAALFLILKNLTNWIVFLTGLIFFFGSLFVLLSVSIYHSTLLQLVKTQKRHQEATATAQAAFSRLKEIQMQLIQQEKMSTIGTLISGVAHEINNPISFLGGNIDPALDYMKDLFGLIDLYQLKLPKPDPDIQAELEAIDFDFLKADLPKLFQSMTVGVNCLRQISNGLRTFSRADSDSPVEANIHDGIDSTLIILEHRLKARSERPAINVHKRYGDLPLIECFFGQLNQVFMNILANAIDALEVSNQHRSFEDIQANPNHIVIKTEFIMATQQIQIRIQDNGSGMSEDIKQKIFDHLFTTKGIGKGTGLGLSIARQIVVEKHHGRLEVNSAPDHGTEFLISIPVKAQNTVTKSHVLLAAVT